MRKINRYVAVVALGAACALPAMAQDTSSTTTTTAPATQSMGAGPEDMTREDDRDLGWMGLLGLAGLLGLRRKHDHHHDNRMTAAR